VDLIEASAQAYRGRAPVAGGVGSPAGTAPSRPGNAEVRQ